MRILRMVCENVKRIKAVDISPKTDVIEVAGRNAQGKSSLMDCIAFALGGKELIQERPVREGEKRAEVTLDLGEMKVTRSWTANDKSYLRIEADGKEQKSPQGILDRLLGQYTFDPLQFARLCETPEGRREQVKVLIGFCGGFDFAAAEKRKSDLYMERQLVNRELRNLEGALAEMPVAPADPGGEKPISDITAKLEEATKIAEMKGQAEKELVAANTATAEAATLVLDERREIERLQAQLQKAEANLEAAQRVHKARLHEATDKERTVNAIKVPDIASIRAEIALAENHNAKVREYRAIVCALDDKRSRLKEKRSEAGKLTDELAAIEQAKVEAIAAADLPVKGLGFDESGVSYNGIPFPQLSSSEQLRVSMAVAMALNPKIKVLRITDGSLLDEASMDIIRQMAGDRGYQVWVEKVQETPDTKPAVVFVEDGEVVSDTTGLRLNGNGSAEKAA